MQRSLIVSLLLVMLFSIAHASAASLEVDGGTIQAFKHPVSLQMRGTSIEARVSASGFWQYSPGGSRYGMSGEVCIKNVGDYPTYGLAITHVVQVNKKGGPPQDYVSQPLDLQAQPVLAPGQEHCYPFVHEFTPAAEAKSYRSVAIVSILNHSGWLPGGPHCEGPEPCPFGPAPKASFNLPDTPTDMFGNTLTGVVWPGCHAAELLPVREKDQHLELAPGETGKARWVLQNSGRCPWDERLRLSYDGDLKLLSGLALLDDGEQVQPGEQTGVTVAFQAPEEPGAYSIPFTLLDPYGEVIPVDGSPDGRLWLTFNVPAPTDTPTPTPTATHTASPTPSAAQTDVPEATASSTPQPSPTPAASATPVKPRPNCVRPLEYWRDHPETWPLDELKLGERTYSRQQGLKLLEKEERTADVVLAQQLAAAKLNLERVDDPRPVDDWVTRADEWLVRWASTKEHTRSEEEKGLEIASELEAFNRGESGPKLCKGVVTPTPSATASFTPTTTPSATPLATLTAVPSGTPAPSAAPPPTETPRPAETATATPTAPPSASPTLTPAVTTQPPDSPTPQPTATPTPPPSPVPEESAGPAQPDPVQAPAAGETAEPPSDNGPGESPDPGAGP